LVVLGCRIKQTFRIRAKLRLNRQDGINRLCAWWSNIQKEQWLHRATPQQRAALKRDLLPIVKIYEQL
jgi:hypothetical protein